MFTYPLPCLFVSSRPWRPIHPSTQRPIHPTSWSYSYYSEDLIILFICCNLSSACISLKQFLWYHLRTDMVICKFASSHVVWRLALGSMASGLVCCACQVPECANCQDNGCARFDLIVVAAVSVRSLSYVFYWQCNNLYCWMLLYFLSQNERFNHIP